MAEYIYESTLKGLMIASTKAFGLPVPSATQAYPIGCLLYDENTGTFYKYIQATAATIAASDVVSWASATTVSTTPASAAGVGSRAGVAPYAFAASYYGFIVVEGPVTVAATSTGYVLGDPVAPDVGSAGHVIEHSVSGSPTQAEVVRAGAIMGFALAVESGGFVLIYVNRCL